MRCERQARTRHAAARARGRLLAALLVALAAATSAARAQERKDSFEASLFSGYLVYGGDLHLKSGGQTGLRFGWHFAPPYAVEFQYLGGAAVPIDAKGSNLVANDTVYQGDTGRSFNASFYTVHFLVSPGNDRRRFKPFAQFGAGWLDWSASPALQAGESGTRTEAIVSVGGGIKFRVAAHTQIRGEVEDLFSVKDLYSNIQASVGVAWVIGGGHPADSDGDGVLDISDRCPDTPKGAIVDKHDGCPWDLDHDGVYEGLDQCPGTPQGWPVDAKGCPLDSDGDSVPDAIDKCASTPKGAIVDASGCPTDSDKDGIADGLDRCPGTPVGATVDPLGSATAGCPRDGDNDQVPDGIDQCPATPPGAWVDAKGCSKDSDGDRVLDGLDRCPDTPAGQKVDKDGCPRVRLDRDEPQILQNVKFHGPGLYPGAEAWLDLLLEAAGYWPDVKFEVAVYTDDEGGAAPNLKAAQKRAEVVRKWLLEHGVPADRFVLRAPGPEKFIADNTSEEGRDRNRRVEVKRLTGDLTIHPAREAPSAEATGKTEPQPETAPQPEAEEPESPGGF